MNRVVPQVCSDEKFEDAKKAILSAPYPTIAHIQRTLDIGYNRAARLMEALIAAEVVTQVYSERHGWKYEVNK